MLVFDIETDGFLDVLTKIHCINIYDTETEREERYNDLLHDVPNYTGSIEQGLERLREAAHIGGHNVHGFDVPALQKIYPDFKPKGKVHDSLAYTRLVWSDILDRDHRAIRSGKRPKEFTGNLAGNHSLRSWGLRLGNLKGDYDGGWETFSKDMDDYCMQDVRVNTDIFNRVFEKEYSGEALNLENDVLYLSARQERNGFAFDVEKAEALLAKLQIRHAELLDELQAAFPPWKKIDKIFTPKVNNKKLGYIKGKEVTKYKTIVFNPASRDHIADRLINMFNWKPREFTEGGKPKVDEDVLANLHYPEAQLLNEYLMINKRLGQLAEGKNAWLKKVERRGNAPRIHGRMNTNGAVTGRMTHMSPNLAQIPSIHNAKGEVPYGKDCRELFTVAPGNKLVGCDADGLELRCLAHYMAVYDGGAYAETVVNGRKEDGTDIHTVNQKIVRLNSRDAAKTFIYAYLYGGGDLKLGEIIYADLTKEQRKGLKPTRPTLLKLGKNARSRIEQGLPALGKLTNKVKKASKKGWLKGLDGRRVKVRSEHSALNSLLQSAGAIVMKRAWVLCDQALQADGLEPGWDYEYSANVHDEFQTEVKESCAEQVGKRAAESIRRAGEYYSFRCPLAGSYDIGDSWADTH